MGLVALVMARLLGFHASVISIYQSDPSAANESKSPLADQHI